MKFLVVGLGSMGKRRIRNLHTLGEIIIIGFDPRKDRCIEAEQKYEINTFQNFDEAINTKPDVMIISTPPDLHSKYAKIAIERKIHFFTEANVVTDEMTEIIDLLKNNDIVGVPSCTLRFHKMFLKLKTILMENKNLGNVLCILHHQGHYLPDWHPWEDYRDFYASKKRTGAGREMVPFELVWLTALFGKIKSIKGSKTRTGILDSEIDDLYNAILDFESGVKGMLTVDVISRIPYRQIKIITEKGVIESDWNKKKIKIFTECDGWEEFIIDSGKPEKNYVHGEGTYVDEIQGFIQAIKKEKKFPYSFKEDLYMLNLLETIEKDDNKMVVND
jgi:predicted dehydrogenase